MSETRLILFDIDGTLVDTRGAGGRAMASAGRSLFGEAFSFEGVDFAGSLDSVIFMNAAERHGLDYHEHHAPFRETYGEHLRMMFDSGEHDSIRLPGVNALLSTLAERDDVVLGLLTGNYGHTGPMKLETCGIDHRVFEITAFGDEALTRPDLVALAMEKYRLAHDEAIDPSRVIVIGDTPKDVHCAKAHHCVSFAVATGRSSVQELRKTGADIVAADLSDPSPVLALLA